MGLRRRRRRKWRSGRRRVQPAKTMQEVNSQREATDDGSRKAAKDSLALGAASLWELKQRSKRFIQK